MKLNTSFLGLWPLAGLALTVTAAPRPQSYDFGAILDAEPDVTPIEIPATATQIVASYTKRLRGQDTLTNGATGNLGAKWTNLDAISFDSSSWPVFDNIAIVKYSTGPAADAATAKPAKRDLDPSIIADPKLDTTPQPDAIPDDGGDVTAEDGNAERPFRPLYRSSGVMAAHELDLESSASATSAAGEPAATPAATP